MSKLNKNMLCLLLSAAMLLSTMSFTVISAEKISPDADKDIAMFIEAEDFKLESSGTYEKIKDKSASGSKCVAASVNNLEEPDAQAPEATYVFTAEETATYYVWMRYKAANSKSDSFYVAFGDQPLNKLSVTYLSATGDAWTWNKICSAKLEKGKHTIKMYCREANLMHDAFYITTDANFVPSEYASLLEEQKRIEEEKRANRVVEPIGYTNTFTGHATMFEAESTASKNNNFSVENDDSASGGKYIVLGVESSLVTDPVDVGAPIASYTIDVPSDGKYYVWIRCKAVARLSQATQTAFGYVLIQRIIKQYIFPFPKNFRG